MRTISDSPFYRVSVKALIFDNEQRLLVFQDNQGTWEMPGGGLEHGETLEQGITRELDEEMRITPATIGAVQFVYTAVHDTGYHKLCLALPVTLKTTRFVPSADDLVAAKYVSREEFERLPFQSNEIAVVQYADQIWSQS
jgi:8-oxo-dGTP diphosphatase